MHQKSKDLSKGVPTSEEINQSRSLPIDPTVKLGDVTIDPNQSRSVGMALQSSDFDHNDTINPFTQMESNPAALHRCVNKVKGKKGIDNAYAVCNASLNRKEES